MTPGLLAATSASSTDPPTLVLVIFGLSLPLSAYAFWNLRFLRSWQYVLGFAMLFVLISADNFGTATFTIAVVVWLLVNAWGMVLIVRRGSHEGTHRESGQRSPQVTEFDPAWRTRNHKAKDDT
jgi:hypothetical protein